MKKITSTLALILCLILCVFAFASCGKKNGGSAATTADNTTSATTAKATEPEATEPGATEPEATEPEATEPEATEPEATEPEVTVPPHEHTPEAEWTVIDEPTCSTPGRKVLYCEECGEEIEEDEIPIDPEAHTVNDWTVTEAVNMFHTTGSRRGECIYCESIIVQNLAFEPTIEAFGYTSGKKYNYSQVDFADVRGDKHFYPTESDPDGNDMMIEFSILWNETIQNLDPAANCYMCGRFDGNKPIYYFSPVPGCSTSDAEFSGAFEYMGNFDTPISDAEVTTPATMCGKSPNYSDYPNIAGPDEANPEYGWHRVGIRYHLELLDGKTGEELTDYVAIATCYVDGVAIFKLSTGANGMQNWESMLFKAESDGEGGVVYSDAGNFIIPFQINKAQSKVETTAYLVLADVYVSCGKDFLMKVEKVASPEAATLEVAEGVEISAPLYFKLAD